MADISVSLVLDDKQFTDALARAISKSEELGKKANTAGQQAGSGFGSFGNSVEGAIKKLEGLSGLLVGVGFAEFIHSSMEAASGMVEMANGMGVAVNSFMEMTLAATTAGKNTEQFGKMVAKMEAQASAAIEGNLKLRDSFKEVGVSTDYMRTHSVDEVMKKIAEGLIAIDDPAKRSAVSMDLFSKAGRNFDAADYLKTLERVAGSQDENADSALRAKEIMDEFAIKVTALKLEFVKLLDPINELIGSETDGFTGAAVAAKVLYGAMVAFAALKVGTMFYEAAIGVTEFTAALVAGEIAAAPMIAAIAAVAAVVGGAGYLAYKAWGNETDKQTEATKKNTDATKKNNEEKAKAGKQPLTNQKDLDPNAGAVQALKNQADALKLTNQLALERLDLEISLVHVSDQERQSKLAAFDAESSRQKEELRIRGEIRKLQIEQANSKEGAKNAGQIAFLQTQLELSKAQSAEVAKRTESLVKEKNAEEMLKAYREMGLKAATAKRDLEDQISDLTATEDQKRLHSIDKQMRAEIELLKLKRQGQMGSDFVMGADEELKIVQQVEEAYAPLIAQQKEFNSQSREFNVGWKGAFNTWVDDATNAAKQAQTVFGAMTTALDGAIQQFVTTGKVNFKDLLVSFVQMIEQMMLKAAAAQVLKSMGMGDIFSGFKADGGYVPAGAFAIAGEAGPEIVRGPATVTSAKDTANMLGGGSTHNYYITNTVSAVDAKSVARLFAENRTLLYGNVEQARKEMPMRTR